MWTSARAGSSEPGENLPSKVFTPSYLGYILPTMRRNDFVFCVGYSGGTAIVDKRLEASHGRLGTKELFSQGLYKCSLASAVYKKSQEELDWFRQEYESLSGRSFRDLDEVKKAFGVSEVFQGIVRTSYL